MASRVAASNLPDILSSVSLGSQTLSICCSDLTALSSGKRNFSYAVRYPDCDESCWKLQDGDVAFKSFWISTAFKILLSLLANDPGEIWFAPIFACSIASLADSKLVVGFGMHKFV